MASMKPEISLAATCTIHTYHCLCTHLLLASTTPLTKLPQRQNSSLDKAYVMPLPPTSTPDSSASSDHYGLLLSTIIDKKPQIVKSDMGFEKRYLQKCGRCRLVVGYQLDWSQFGSDKAGRREDVVYLLPGGFVGTEDMVKGKMSEADIGFGEVTKVL